jgi:hypothetical protein
VLVHRGILLLWLVLMSLAPWARADDEDSRVARPPQTGPSQAVRPAAGPNARWDDHVQPVQYVAQNPNPSGPREFSAEPVEPAAASIHRSQNYWIFDDEPAAENQEPPQEFAESLDHDAPAPATSSGDWLHNGRWYTQQSVVYMSRSEAVKNDITLARDFSSAALARQQNALNIVDHGFQPGMRSVIGKFLGRDDHNRDHAVEFTFLGLTHWRASGGLAAVSPGGIFTLLDPTNAVPGFNAASSQSYIETSSFNSFELSYRVSRRLSRDQMVYTRDSTWVRQCVPTALPSVFGGVRVVSLNETLGYFSQTVAPVSNGAYFVSTHNTLVGPQIGTDWFYERSEWRVGFRAKGGGFVNWANQASKVQITDANGVLVPSMQNRTQFASTDIMSFVGELSVIGMYQIRPNFALRTSYDIMWVTDLALAQNQVSFIVTNPASIAVQHSLNFQGFSLGFEYIR